MHDRALTSIVSAKRRGWFFESFWLDLKLGNFSPKEKRGFLLALRYRPKKRRRPVKEDASSRVKGEKKEFDSHLMEKHFRCQ